MISGHSFGTARNGGCSRSSSCSWRSVAPGPVGHGGRAVHLHAVLDREDGVRRRRRCRVQPPGLPVGLSTVPPGRGRSAPDELDAATGTVGAITRCLRRPSAIRVSNSVFPRPVRWASSTKQSSVHPSQTGMLSNKRRVGCPLLTHELASQLGESIGHEFLPICIVRHRSQGFLARCVHLPKMDIRLQDRDESRPHAVRDGRHRGMVGQILGDGQIDALRVGLEGLLRRSPSFLSALTNCECRATETIAFRNGLFIAS